MFDSVRITTWLFIPFLLFLKVSSLKIKLFKNFQGCFTVQLSRFFMLCADLHQLFDINTTFRICQEVFYFVFQSFYFVLTERRRRDLNPRTAINDLLPFQGSPFSRLGTSPNAWLLRLFYLNFQRRGWDSNPCALSDKRFSRPPRYDHFATSPVSIEAPHLGACRIIPSLFLSVKPFFSFFWFFQIFLLLIHFMM